MRKYNIWILYIYYMQPSLYFSSKMGAVAGCGGSNPRYVMKYGGKPGLKHSSSRKRRVTRNSRYKKASYKRMRGGNYYGSYRYGLSKNELTPAKSALANPLPFESQKTC
jgi:hypothetical protein